MKSLTLKIAALGVVASLPMAAMAAEQSKTLGSLQADFVVSPSLGSNATKTLAGSPTKIDPRDLAGPAKSVTVTGPLPAAMMKQ